MFEEILGQWDYSTLPANVRVGRDCFLERKESFARFNSQRSPGLVLGDRVRIYTWSSISVDPNGLIEIGNDSVLVGAILMCHESIRIGERVLISYNVTIADSDFHPINPDDRRLDAMANAPGGDKSSRPAVESRPVAIGEGAWVGIGALILKGVQIGRDARIGAGAVVTADVPAGGHVAGNPARGVKR
jgi:acetyltransferase-like isoleucine patch superfamily enzyme